MDFGAVLSRDWIRCTLNQSNKVFRRSIQEKYFVWQILCLKFCQFNNYHSFWRTFSDFVSFCLFIICKWTPLSDELLWFWWIDFKVNGQLIGFTSVTNHKTSNEPKIFPEIWYKFQEIAREVKILFTKELLMYLAVFGLSISVSLDTIVDTLEWV